MSKYTESIRVADDVTGEVNFRLFEEGVKFKEKDRVTVNDIYYLQSLRGKPGVVENVYQTTGNILIRFDHDNTLLAVEEKYVMTEEEYNYMANHPETCIES